MASLKIELEDLIMLLRGQPKGSEIEDFPRYLALCSMAHQAMNPETSDLGAAIQGVLHGQSAIIPKGGLKDSGFTGFSPQAKVNAVDDLEVQKVQQLYKGVFPDTIGHPNADFNALSEGFGKIAAAMGSTVDAVAKAMQQLEDKQATVAALKEFLIPDYGLKDPVALIKETGISVANPEHKCWFYWQVEKYKGFNLQYLTNQLRKFSGLSPARCEHLLAKGGIFAKHVPYHKGEAPVIPDGLGKKLFPLPCHKQPMSLTVERLNCDSVDKNNPHDQIGPFTLGSVFSFITAAKIKNHAGCWVTLGVKIKNLDSVVYGNEIVYMHFDELKDFITYAYVNLNMVHIGEKSLPHHE